MNFFFFFLFQIDLLNREWKILFIESVILHVKLCTGRYCSELSCWVFFFLWMTLSLCLTALGWFISLDLWEIKSPGIADFQLVERNQITLGAQDKIILAKYYVEVSSCGLISLLRAATVLIVIWWLSMEGDCCFSYSFLRSLPIKDSILVFHLMAFAQICINCKMIFGPTTRGLP